MGDNIKKTMMVCRGERQANTKFIPEWISQMEVNKSRYLDSITTSSITIGQYMPRAVHKHLPVKFLLL